MMSRNSIRLWALLVLFVALIFLPLLNESTHLIKDLKSTENRKSAEKPDIRVTGTDTFPTLYENYYNDKFTLRTMMIHAFNWFKLVTFHISPVPEFVIVGKDNWLFLAGAEFDAFTGKNPLTSKEMSDIKNELEFRKKYLESKNCKFYLLIVPCKPVIYPEKVPFEIRRKRFSNGELLQVYLEKTSTLKLVNAYTILKTEKVNNPMYYATDNHWTRLGAFNVANEFFRIANKDFQDVRKLNLNEYSIAEKDTFTGNTSAILGHLKEFRDRSILLSPRRPLSKKAKPRGYIPDSKFPYRWLYEQVRTIPGSSKPTLLTITDSFGEYIFPLLSENFSRTVKIWDNWEYKLNEDIVEREHPDLFLLVIHEKNLIKLIKHSSNPAVSTP